MSDIRIAHKLALHTRRNVPGATNYSLVLKQEKYYE
ncbi:MAG: Hypothetical protein BHV28_09930 [Candidatus Tokpelaia hoelldobleri]|uniref:Uncharacterized protein n=1 Tax=Candidatus Tokpelaia hoelldobleri TaxID=1902579 RepID=A0A1U9JUY4_9HYPH|nr:MAG: Hypothetical protein BHV28_09930 [Candidatus Tokpelaia hoelldoblerii]